MPKTKAMLAAEQRLGEPIETWLRARYHVDDLTLEEIAERLEVNESTIWHWMRRVGIGIKRLRPPEDDEA